jgi:hypothetical protein
MYSTIKRIKNPKPRIKHQESSIKQSNVKKSKAKQSKTSIGSQFCHIISYRIIPLHFIEDEHYPRDSSIVEPNMQGRMHALRWRD